MHSEHITTNVVSSNPAHGEVYSIQHYVIKLISDSRQVGSFLRVFRFPPSIKLTGHDITEILLKVALSTITLTLYANFGILYAIFTFYECFTLSHRELKYVWSWQLLTICKRSLNRKKTCLIWVEIALIQTETG